MPSNTTAPPPVQVSTFAVLTEGTAAGGVKVLRGQLSRDTTTVDFHGHKREFPRGAELVLRRNVGSYSLLILTPEDSQPLSAEAAQRAINDAVNPDGTGEHDDIPF